MTLRHLLRNKPVITSSQSVVAIYHFIASKTCFSFQFPFTMAIVEAEDLQVQRDRHINVWIWSRKKSGSSLNPSSPRFGTTEIHLLSGQHCHSSESHQPNLARGNPDQPFTKPNSITPGSAIDLLLGCTHPLYLFVTFCCSGLLIFAHKSWSQRGSSGLLGTRAFLVFLQPCLGFSPSPPFSLCQGPDLDLTRFFALKLMRLTLETRLSGKR